MKIKKTISMENWLVNEILKRFPRSRKNFSAAIEALLIASINNPLEYWRYQAKYHKQRFDLAMQQVNLFRSIEIENKKDKDHYEVRKKILLEKLENE